MPLPLRLPPPPLPLTAHSHLVQYELKQLQEACLERSVRTNDGSVWGAFDKTHLLQSLPTAEEQRQRAAAYDLGCALTVTVDGLTLRAQPGLADGAAVKLYRRKDAAQSGGGGDEYALEVLMAQGVTVKGLSIRGAQDRLGGDAVTHAVRVHSGAEASFSGTYIRIPPAAVNSLSDPSSWC